MLDLDPDKLATEIQRAEDFRRKHTLRTAAIAARFMGNWFRVDLTSDPTPENTIFAYVAYMLPELWYSTPDCRIKAKRPIQHQDIADSMEGGVKTWLTETDFTDEGQQVVRDALMGYGFMQVGIEPRDFPGDAAQQTFKASAPDAPDTDTVAYDDGIPDPPQPDAPPEPQEALRPFAIRLSPDQLIMDPRCETPLKARYIGHSYWMDIDELRAKPDVYDPAGVEKLAESPRDYYDENRQERAVRYGESADRHRVNLVDLWVPEHGKLITLARNYEATNTILRSVDYWGPPEGPYEVFGFYCIPGDPYPMGPIQPIMEQLEEMWVHQAQTSEEAKSYKRFVLVEAANIEGQKAVQNAKSGDIALVKGLNGNFVEVEMGGSPTGRLEHIATLRDRADRTIGLSDAQRGRVQGKTATETDIVQGNVDTRTSFLRTRVQRHTTRVLRRVCWYLFYDPAVVLPVSKTDPQTGQVLEGTFLGGIQKGQEGTGWIDFNLDIDPQSMPHSDDAMIQQRAMELLQVAQQVGEGMQMMPQVNWRYLVNMFGESFNQKDLFSLLFNPAAMQPQMPVLPGGVNPELVAQGLGTPGGPGPQWGGIQAMGGMPGGGGAPGMMPGGLGGGPGMPMQGPPPFAPRTGGVAPPMGAGGGAAGGMSGVMKFPMAPRQQQAAGGGSGGAKMPFMFIGRGKPGQAGGASRHMSGAGKFGPSPRAAKHGGGGPGVSGARPFPASPRAAKHGGGGVSGVKSFPTSPRAAKKAGATK